MVSLFNNQEKLANGKLRYTKAEPAESKLTKEFSLYGITDEREVFHGIPVCKLVIVCDKCGEFEKITTYCGDNENYIECLTCGAKEYGKS